MQEMLLHNTVIFIGILIDHHTNNLKDLKTFMFEKNIYGAFEKQKSSK